MRLKYLTTISAAALISASVAQAEPLKVGFLATLEGTYTVLGEDGLRGFKVALDELNNMAGGREIEVVIAATDARQRSARRAQGCRAGQGGHRDWSAFRF